MAPKKMKVRMKVSIASVNPPFNYDYGQVVLLDAEQAKQWVLIGHAEQVPNEEPLTETAALAAKQTYSDPRIYSRLRGTRLM